MSDSHYIEQEIEARRASVEDTLDKLKQRMSIDQIVDDVGQFLGMDDVRGALQTAGRQVRENPIPIGLIGLGVAWLMLGKAGPAQSSDNPRDDHRHSFGDANPSSLGRSGSHGGPSAASDFRSDYRAEIAQDARSLVGRVQDAASDLGDTIGRAPEKVRDLVAGASERGQSAVDSLRETAAATVRPLTHVMTGQPLLIGAVALAAGAVIGSALPRTRTENRLLGPQRDRLVDQAAAVTRDIGDRAAEAVQTTCDAATQAARDEGLITEGQTIAEKVERVASATFDAARSQIEPVLHGVEDAAEPRKTARARR